MIENISLAFEILSVLVVLGCLYKHKFKIDMSAALLIIIDVVIFHCINRYDLSVFFELLVYVLITAYTYFKYSDTLKRTVLNVLIAIVIVGFVQLCLGMIEIFGDYMIEDESIWGFIVNAATLITLLILSGKKDIQLIGIFRGNANQFIQRIVMWVLFLFFMMIVLYKIRKHFSFTEYILLISICVVVCLLLAEWRKEKLLNIENGKRVRLRHICDSYYDKMLTDIRSRQHEFNNHLTAIKGISYTCRDYAELVEKQKDYCEQILEHNKYNKLIYSCKNPVLDGFLYNKFIQADELGVCIEYSVILDEINENEFEIFDLIEIIGILFDNAVEAVADKQEKKIHIAVWQEPEEIVIKVENVNEFIQSKEIDNFLGRGIAIKARAED